MSQNIAKENKKQNSGKYAVVFVCLMAVLYGISVLFIWLKPEDMYSNSERRALAQKPVLEKEVLLSGEYAKKMEKYMVDQFPMRDGLRSLKSNFSLKVMQKQDTHNVYVKDGYLCKMEYPMKKDSISRATMIFENIFAKYLQDTDVTPYISIVPDKNYFLADEDVLAMDYDTFFDEVYRQTPHLQPISITKQLQLTDYYRTDTHWKQEEIIDVAAVLAESMNVPFKDNFTVQKTDTEFYGVYYGQAGLNLVADEISYCTNESLEGCYVYDYENDKEIPLYSKDKLTGKDPYEMFLGGNVSLVTIENEKALSEKELVVFGDSFSRSLLSLLAGSYAKITLVDIRYLPSVRVGEYIEFVNQDVLFIYSTSVLNDSITIK